MKTPVAVVISDIHYNINTLSVADAALKQAVSKAQELSVPLFIAGDLHDTKANLRGECVTAMINTLKNKGVYTIILRGNHDQINEKSEAHSLDFLSLLNEVIVVDTHLTYQNIYFIPYQSSVETFKQILGQVPKGSTIIMHQGVTGSQSGEYIQDHSAINKDLLADYRVISGHYHTRQDIKCGRPRKGLAGLMSYIGNPYTLNFGEANDPEKGFRVLNDDGTLDFIPTNLRKHRVIELEVRDGYCSVVSGDIFLGNKEDIIKVKASGTKEHLSTITKKTIAEYLNYSGDFKLEMTPKDTISIKIKKQAATKEQTLDVIIDNLEHTSIEQKERLKTLWKAICK